MNKLFFTTVNIAGAVEDNQSFYLSEEEARRETETRIHDEIRNMQKLIHDYQLDMPVLAHLLKDLSVSVSIREYKLLCEEQAS